VSFYNISINKKTQVVRTVWPRIQNAVTKSPFIAVVGTVAKAGIPAKQHSAGNNVSSGLFLPITFVNNGFSNLFLP